MTYGLFVSEVDEDPQKRDRLCIKIAAHGIELPTVLLIGHLALAARLALTALIRELADKGRAEVGLVS